MTSSSPCEATAPKQITAAELREYLHVIASAGLLPRLLSMQTVQLLTAVVFLASLTQPRACAAAGKGCRQGIGHVFDVPEESVSTTRNLSVALQALEND